MNTPARTLRKKVSRRTERSGEEMESERDMVVAIMKALIAKTNSLETSQSLLDLAEQGVTGNLLKEVFSLMDRCGFVVDTSMSESFDELVDSNIKDCKRILKYHPESAATASELALLQTPAQVTLGLQWDHGTDKNIEADTGRPLLVRRFSGDSKELISRSEQRTRSMVIIEDRLLVLVGAGDSFSTKN